MRYSSTVRPARAIASFGLAAALALTCFVPATPAFGVTAAQKAAEAESALNQLNAMQQTLDEASASYFQSLTEYQQAIEARDASQERIEEISKEIEGIQSRLGERAREMYRNGSTSFLDMLLGAATFDEFTQNWDLLNRVNETDADLSIKAKDLREEEKAQEAFLAEQEKMAERKSAEAGRAFEEASALVEQMQATYEALSAEAQALYAAEQEAAYAAAAAAAMGGAEAQTGGVQNDDGTVTDIATGQVYSSPSDYSAATGNAVVDRAMSMLGHGYQWGATGTNGKFDCSGLVGYALTGTTDRIGNTTTFMGWNQVKNPQPGDVVVNSGHTGIYIGDGQMIHAADENTGVVVGKVQSGMIYVRP